MGNRRRSALLGAGPHRHLPRRGGRQLLPDRPGARLGRGCGRALLPRAPAHAGATEAIVLLASYVFDELGYRRFEWKLDSLNAPSAAAARRLGFRYEGRFRNAMVYQGRNRDTDWFAMTDEGQQRTRLSDLTAR